MRNGYAFLFIIIIIGLAAGVIAALNTRRSMRYAVAAFLAGIIPPVMGNLIIVLTTNQTAAIVGYYIYFLGMDAMMITLLYYTFRYCDIRKKKSHAFFNFIIIFLFAVDSVQYVLNPFFHQAFSIERTVVDGRFYYRLVPYIGQTCHRVLDYGVLLVILVVLLVKIIRSTRVVAERYLLIFVSLIACGTIEGFFIFSRTPIDRAMIVFAIFGFLTLYFTLYYRPLRLLDGMLANMASEMPEALFFYDESNRCIWANKLGIEFTGVTEKNYEPVTKRLEGYFNNLDFEHGDWSTKCEAEGQKGKEYYVVSRQTIKDAKNRIAGFLITVRDITKEQVELEREIYNAEHDSLTGLFTREYFYTKIREMMKNNPDEEYVAAYLDVMDFKMVNDIFGNKFGDYVLKHMADRIRQEISEFSISGRLVGDTFGLFIPRSRFNPKHIEELLSKFHVALGEKEVFIRVHFGIYEVPKPAPEPSVMFDRARMAIATIKDNYEIQMAYYDEKMRKEVLWSKYISEQLTSGLENKQIRPYLQPIVNPTGNVVGAEALVRWIHPKDGFLSPAEFVPIFEKNGMIAQMDLHMWRCACEILAGWKDTNPDRFISINISPKDFYFMDVADEIKKIVDEYKINPSQLRIEITETVMMTEVDKRIEILEKLRNDGFIVEMDDFGSGFSSLNMLKDMPVDVIKIDMGFLNKSNDDEKARTILHNIINLSEDLGITSLTEGVETANQHKMLMDMGCKLFQGYYFAKPMPVEDFEEYCSSSRKTG